MTLNKLNTPNLIPSAKMRSSDASIVAPVWHPDDPAAPEKPLIPLAESYDIYFTGYWKSKKIAVVKRLRELTGWGLKRTVDTVHPDAQAVRIREAVSIEDATAIQKDLEDTGATIQIVPHQSLPSLSYSAE